MKRRFQTLGIFASKHTDGALMVGTKFECIYNRLKDLGFKETRWQYVFSGQIGGLVLPINDPKALRSGADELHVRFYEDRIFAEYEIGRSYLSHFVGPRYNANAQMLVRYAESMSEDEVALWESHTQTACLAEQEREMEVWDGRSRFDKLRDIQAATASSLILIALFNLGWKGVVVLLSLLILTIVGWTVPSVALSAVSILAAWLFLPGRGDPS